MHPGVQPTQTPRRGPGAALVLSGGTNIGDMTGDGGLASAFDGVTGQAGTAAASKSAVPSTGSAYAGKTVARPSAVSKATVYGSNNAGYVNAVDPSTTIALYGKQGAAPANDTDGTLLGSITFTDTANESTGRDIASSDQLTYWDHLWARISHVDGSSRTLRLAELQLTGWIT